MSGTIESRGSQRAVVTLRLAGVALLLAAGTLLLAALPLGGAAPPASPTVAPLAATGKMLFQAKGCASCHAHAQVPAQRAWIGAEPPDLTTYAGDPAFVRAILADPAAVRPGTAMPNLDLTQAEIEALTAFLTTRPATP